MRSKPSCTKLFVFIVLVLCQITSAQRLLPRRSSWINCWLRLRLTLILCWRRLQRHRPILKRFWMSRTGCSRTKGCRGRRYQSAEAQGFDAAFIALVNFPDVLNMMAESVDDFASIGQAFSADQGAVSASVQRLRAQAHAAGNLQNNQQQQVEVQQSAGQTIYVIQPANPQVVYVPVYNPTVVYVRPPTNVVVVSYGPAIPIGFWYMSARPWGWMGWGWNWTSHRCYYNHTVWVGWRNPYRPPHIWYRPRPVPYNSRPGYGGNWHYRPPNYRPPTPVKLPANRPPWGPNHRPGYPPPPNNRPGTGRPPMPQPKPGKPSQPIAKPYPNRPPETKPAPLPRPSPQPRPTPQQPRPSPRPVPQQPRPTPQPKPNPQKPRPAPQAKPAPQPQPAPPNRLQPQAK